MPLSLLLQQLRPLLRIPPSRAGIGRRVVVVATRAVPFLLFSPPRTPRPFGTALHLSPPLRSKKNVNFPPRPKPPPDEEIEESFLKGSGPGGQKINKTNSAVQLKHLPTGIVIKSQATRSRSQNRLVARQLLADKLDRINRGDESRAAVVGEVRRKRKASSAKKSRRKYRKLDGDKENPGEQEILEEDDDNEADELEEQHPPDQGATTDNRK
ncbi:RF-1 domain-containing protein [Hypoxylon rubiginosum]|uniref:RF-1 domain-containing protein n=1 Tax=Hypoxylon rubiginosum TaxID=110542 RepID=A0ACB9Z9H2_9PEZI|nr:RF-1 domain-containing protein [Hypoxylon rubiginosum]